jgi:hypothetical protein
MNFGELDAKVFRTSSETLSMETIVYFGLAVLEAGLKVLIGIVITQSITR